VKELQSVVAAWSEADARGERSLLATVVETAGSTYRRPGARLLMTEERWLAGAISGGCLEGDVLKRSWWRTASGAPVCVSYDSTSDDDIAWGFGLGCNGRVEVLLERLREPGPLNPLSLAAHCLQKRQTGVLATVYRATEGTDLKPGQRLLLWPDGAVHTDVGQADLVPRLAEDAHRALESGSCRRTYSTKPGSVDVFVEVIRPAQSLVVFGNGYDAVPLVRLAVELGWQVTVVADRPSPVARSAFSGATLVVATPETVEGRVLVEPEAAAVVMTHNLEHDAGFLRLALASGCRYLGVLGPRRRTEVLLSQIGPSSIGPERGPPLGLHAPVGLDLGAEQPEEIALAIVAEIRAATASRTGGFLRDRPGPLHGEHR
jgi:xanthine dehydrogenase accessory factor